MSHGAYEPTAVESHYIAQAIWMDIYYSGSRGGCNFCQSLVMLLSEDCWRLVSLTTLWSAILMVGRFNAVLTASIVLWKHLRWAVSRGRNACNLETLVDFTCTDRRRPAVVYVSRLLQIELDFGIGYRSSRHCLKCSNGMKGSAAAGVQDRSEAHTGNARAPRVIHWI